MPIKVGGRFLGFLFALLLALGFLTCWSEPVWAQDSQNRFQVVDGYISELDTSVPLDLIRAIAWVESTWRQFKPDGTTFVDGSMSRRTHKISRDFGIMQINEKTLVDSQYKLSPKEIRKIKTSTRANLKFGLKVYLGKIAYVRDLRSRPSWPQTCSTYKLDGLSETEMVIIAYNGFQVDHTYLRLVVAAMRDKPWEKFLDAGEK